MHGDAVLRVAKDGEVSTVVEVDQPSGLGWLPDGSLLISSMACRCVMRYDGRALARHADLSSLAPYEINDMCVDRHGHVFVGQFGYDMRGGAAPAPASLLRVDPDGSAHEVAEDLRLANGMAITADGATSLVAESWGNASSPSTRPMTVRSAIAESGRSCLITRTASTLTATAVSGSQARCRTDSSAWSPEAG
jgi:sugar lactone lactonase YvrE